MDSVNAAARRVFDLVWAPFDRLPPSVGLLVLGVAFGVVALITMKYTTNPKRVERFKDRYQGHILAIKLFRDSFTVVVSSLVKTLGWIGCYLGEQFKPMLVLLIPFALLFGQLLMRIGYRPYKLGEAALVVVDLAEAVSPMEVALALPSGLELAAKPVREPAARRFVFAVKAKSAGEHRVRLTHGAETVEKTILAGDLAGAPMVQPMRSSDFMDRLLYPGEPGFAAGSAFQKIELHYPARPIPVLGVDVSFGSEVGIMIVFVLITIAAAFALKGVFGVTI